MIPAQALARMRTGAGMRACARRHAHGGWPLLGFGLRRALTARGALVAGCTVAGARVVPDGGREGGPRVGAEICASAHRRARCCCTAAAAVHTRHFPPNMRSVQVMTSV